jgi:Zn-dependent M28 family amino/carboxypeptidase
VSLLKKIIPLGILFILLVTAGCAAGQPSSASSLAVTTLQPTSTVRLFTPSPSQTPTTEPQTFNGQKAWDDVAYQVSFGARIPESPAHQQVENWIVDEVRSTGWRAEFQNDTVMGHPVHNIIAKFGQGRPWVVVAAHYDSRLKADQDPDLQKRSQPVPAANDGASGVAVLLELARILPTQLNASEGTSIPGYRQIWLVFLDAEDNGDIPGWDWILGSKSFVGSLQDKPDAAVVIDMIGDANLNIYKELNSNPQLTDQIWAQADRLGYSQYFIPQPKYRMLDDHIPFIDAGIPAVDVIDFDYPYWHTTADTADKVSAQSLKIVGDTLLAWLIAPAYP